MTMKIKRLSMRKFNDILRLHHGSGLSCRAIAAALNIGYGTVVICTLYWK
jgi:transposase